MIGIFDSGIGGVSVFKCILKYLGNYQYIYYSDSKNNPYGDKTKEELEQITREVVRYLIQKGCKIIVIACNTASAICKDMLRESFQIPIIAIEPAYKMVYDNSYDGQTLILATKGTLESQKFLELFHKYDNHKTIIYECVGLADLIEQDKKQEIEEYLKKHLSQFKGVCNVVLGCTHYPLIKKEIAQVLGNVQFYEGSLGITHRLREVIQEIGLKEEELKIEFVDSSKEKKKEERFWEILRKDV